jgi:hypothetical protein
MKSILLLFAVLISVPQSRAQSNESIRSFVYFLHDAHRRVSECAGYYGAMSTLIGKQPNLSQEAKDLREREKFALQFAKLLEVNLGPTAQGSSATGPSLTDGRLKLFNEELLRYRFPDPDAIALLSAKYTVACQVTLEQLPAEIEQWKTKISK